MKLVTVDEMRRIETEADAGGHTFELMMEHAGKGLADVVAEEYPYLADKSVLGLVGSGNNGGDTLVALALLSERGWRASAYLVNDRPADDPLLERLEKAGGQVVRAGEDAKFKRMFALLKSHSVLLDGVLGTGVRLPLRGAVADALRAARQALETLPDPPHVVAVDCPSGVDTGSGEVAAGALPAELTVTMAAAKVGLVRFPAFELVGELRAVDIGLPEDLEPWRAVKRRVADPELVRGLLPPRPMDAHKGTFGTVMVVAGSVNFTGAVLLAGEAAYRIGAGLVTLAVPAPLHGALAGHIPEATWLLLPHEVGVIAESAAGVVRKHLARATAMVLGPGFGLEDTTRGFLARLIGAEAGSLQGGGIGFVRAQREHGAAESEALPPLVVDADGLKLLAQIPKWRAHLPGPAVLTPHPGEMAILTGEEKEQIQADRLAAAERYAAEWGHVVVLKGALTVVAEPGGGSAVIPVATPALARAGTGDVLTGLIAGLRAQGVDAYPAAVVGAWVHAQAGLYAAQVMGNAGSVLAGDVLASVPDVISELIDRGL